MKKLTLLFLTTLSLISCGKNAYLSSNSDRLINTIQTEELIINTFISTAVSDLSGNIDSGFDTQINNLSGSKSIEDFSSLSLGSSLEISNSFDSITYTMEHVDDDGDLGGTRRNLYIESPVSQDSATGDGNGIDFRYGSLTTKNAMLVTFDKPIAHFGVDLLDFESDSNFTLGKLRAYDCSDSPQKIYESDINFETENGDSEVHFAGLISNQVAICKVILVVGDDSSGDGKSEKFAIDNLRFGTATN